jgi:hypothetical protein
MVDIVNNCQETEEFSTTGATRELRPLMPKEA